MLLKRLVCRELAFVLAISNLLYSIPTVGMMERGPMCGAMKSARLNVLGEDRAATICCCSIAGIHPFRKRRRKVRLFPTAPRRHSSVD